MARAHLQAGERVKAARAHQRRAGGRVAGEDHGVHPPGGADHPRGRPGMEPEGDVHGDPGLDRRGAEVGGGGGDRGPLAGSGGRDTGRVQDCPRAGGATRPRASDLGTLGVQRPGRLERHPLQRLAQPRGHRRRHRALDQGGGAQQHPAAALLGEQLQRHLGGEQGAAQVHEHQHPALRPGRLDGGGDPHRVGAQCGLGWLHAPRRDDPDLLPGHRPGQLRGPLGELGAVRDQDQPDRRCARWEVAGRSDGGRLTRGIGRLSGRHRLDAAAPGDGSPGTRWPWRCASGRSRCRRAPGRGRSA